jgi:hypothetical protein
MNQNDFRESGDLALVRRPAFWSISSLPALRRVRVDEDLILSCPPYWNHDVYSDDPADLSTLGSDTFFDPYAGIIAGAVSRLRDHRFTVRVIGDVRDAGGYLINLLGKTVEVC